MAHAFLSDAWFDAVDAIRDEQPAADGTMADLKLNIVVTSADAGDVEANLNGGQFDRGHVEGASTKLTVPFDVAKKLFIDGDQSAAMQAFMSGQIKVEGDMSKIMAMGSGGSPSAEQDAFQAKLRGLTA